MASLLLLCLRQCMSNRLCSAFLKTRRGLTWDQFLLKATLILCVNVYDVFVCNCDCFVRNCVIVLCVPLCLCFVTITQSNNHTVIHKRNTFFFCAWLCDCFVRNCMIVLYVTMCVCFLHNSVWLFCASLCGCVLISVCVGTVYCMHRFLSPIVWATDRHKLTHKVPPRNFVWRKHHDQTNTQTNKPSHNKVTCLFQVPGPIFRPYCVCVCVCVCVWCPCGNSRQFVWARPPDIGPPKPF